jgi:hypothetical protein
MRAGGRAAFLPAGILGLAAGFAVAAGLRLGCSDALRTQRPKNVLLYQSLDFWPGSLTALTAKELGASGPNIDRLAAREHCRRNYSQAC